MIAALLQMTSGDDPDENLRTTIKMIEEAARGGAKLVLTPEVTNCVSMSRNHQARVLKVEEDDVTLAGVRVAARDNDIHVLIGSLALKTNDPDGRFANRSFLIAPSGSVVARYDKIHMFDVDLSEGEQYKESDGYRPGNMAALAPLDSMMLGMTICYDLRFPQLFRRLAQSGASVISVPSAFSVPTGNAHWETLIRARAIESGCFVLAPAQSGEHPTTEGPTRRTYGHSLAVDPWGKVLVDAGTDPGVHLVEIDADAVLEARRRVPSLLHDRDFAGPDVG